MLHNTRNFRQEPAQNTGNCRVPLVACAPSGNVRGVNGIFPTTSLTDQPIPATSLFGWASASCAGLPGFLQNPRKPLNRQGFAQQRTPLEFPLRACAATGFVDLSTYNKNQGWAQRWAKRWAECEQENSTLHWRCWWALRPAARPPANRRYMARGRACLARTLLMAIRCLGPLRGLRVTICIARTIRGNAARSLAGTNLSDIRFPLGPNRYARRAVAGHLACGGVLRSPILNRPIHNRKDTPCSKRS